AHGVEVVDLLGERARRAGLDRRRAPGAALVVERDATLLREHVPGARAVHVVVAEARPAVDDEERRARAAAAHLEGERPRARADHAAVLLRSGERGACRMQREERGDQRARECDRHGETAAGGLHWSYSGAGLPWSQRSNHARMWCWFCTRRDGMPL